MEFNETITIFNNVFKQISMRVLDQFMGILLFIVMMFGSVAILLCQLNLFFCCYIWDFIRKRPKLNKLSKKKKKE
jgi:hypothetical protein